MPVVNPFAVIAGTLSAGTTKATLGEVVPADNVGVGNNPGPAGGARYNRGP